MYVEKRNIYYCIYIHSFDTSVLVCCQCFFFGNNEYIASQVWVIRLIKDSSKMRQTQWEIGYQQIKACIEISHKCTQPKPKDRPSMLDILNTLEEKEAVGPTPNDLVRTFMSG